MSRKVKLAEATVPEMLAYARITLGIPKGQVPDHTGPETLRSKIAALLPEGTEDIVIPENAPMIERPAGQHGGHVAPLAPEGRATAANGMNDPKVTLTIFKTEKNKGEPITLSVNGRAMSVPVGQKVDLPYRYFEVLQNSITTQYDFNDKTNEIDSREEPRHTYNVHRFPSQEQLDKWNAELMEGQAAA